MQDAVVVGQQTPDAATTTWAHVVANQTNRFMEVRLGYTGDTVPTGVTYNGVAFILADEASSGALATNRKSAIWYLANPAAGTHNIVVTWGVGIQQMGNYVSVSWYGVNPSAPIGVPAKVAATTGTTASVAPASALGDVVIDALSVRTTSAITGSASQTNDVDQLIGTNLRQTGGHLPGLAGTTTMSYSWTGTENNALVAVAIKVAHPAGGAGSTLLLGVG